MLVKTYGSAVYGVNALTITIEVNISTGTKYYMVGQPVFNCGYSETTINSICSVMQIIKNSSSKPKISI
ncbi:hypothetical protein EYS08_19220 [Pedobacter kyonggii]|uniref:Uncharacterized protein n=1 Tax=Pedobacter kyonggii TaxID=1926871 RepID=A0A4V2JGG4_9SPHI|nr:hypothetical protein EYS08_19220 [Pedobacter kyonggii]